MAPRGVLIKGFLSIKEQGVQGAGWSWDKTKTVVYALCLHLPGPLSVGYTEAARRIWVARGWDGGQGDLLTNILL